jgi:hypothetical protein
MPNLPISQLPDISTSSAGRLIPSGEFAVAQDGTTYKVPSSGLNPFPVVYGLYSQTATTETITGTTEQSMINGGIGTLTVGANQFNIGDSFEAQFGGLITNTNNHRIRFRVKTDTIILADSDFISIASNTSSVFSLTLNFTIRQIGSATNASIITLGTFQTAKTSNASLEGFGFNDLNDTDFDTTISNTLNVTAEFETSGDSLSVEFFRLMKTY